MTVIHALRKSCSERMSHFVGSLSTEMKVLLYCMCLVIYQAVGQLVTAPPQYKGEKGDKGEVGATGATGPQGVNGPVVSVFITDVNETRTILFLF